MRLSNKELRRTARAFNDHKGNETKAADALGLNRSTIQKRLVLVRRKFPKLLKTFEKSRGGSAPAELNELMPAWQAWHVAGFNTTAAAQALKLPASTLQNQLRRYAQLTGLKLSDFKHTPTTLHQDVHSHEKTETVRAERAKLKDAVRTITELRDKLKDLEWAAHASLEPAEWALPSRTPKKREHMPYLLTSDFQVGEVVRAQETEAGYGYDSEIFRRRYRRMIDTTIYLSTEHAGSLWSYPGMIYARGGDTISGGIHDELRETDDLTPIEACELVFEEESAGIEKLVEAFGRVEVKTPGGAGNHDRNTFKPVTKKASAHSYDRLIAYMLRRHFRNDERVTFHTSESFDVRFPIYNRNILLTHGDRIGSRGGQGFIGPAATILRGWQKVIMEQAALGYHVDEVHNGHFHTPFWMPWGLSNGCMPGYSEYAKSFRMRPEPPTQMLVYHHPRRGAVDIKPINLQEA